MPDFLEVLASVEPVAKAGLKMNSWTWPGTRKEVMISLFDHDRVHELPSTSEFLDSHFRGSYARSVGFRYVQERNGKFSWTYGFNNLGFQQLHSPSVRELTE